MLLPAKSRKVFSTYESNFTVKCPKNESPFGMAIETSYSTLLRAAARSSASSFVKN
jgi:hypothetical protein